MSLDNHGFTRADVDLTNGCGQRERIIDLQALGTSQAPERTDILNLGGFTDGMFGAMHRFVARESGGDWVGLIKETSV